MAYHVQSLSKDLDPYAALGCAVLRQALADSRRADIHGREARDFLSGEWCQLWAEFLDIDKNVIAVRIAQAGA